MENRKLCFFSALTILEKIVKGKTIFFPMIFYLLSVSHETIFIQSLSIFALKQKKNNFNNFVKQLYLISSGYLLDFYSKHEHIHCQSRGHNVKTMNIVSISM